MYGVEGDRFRAIPWMIEEQSPPFIIQIYDRRPQELAYTLIRVVTES